MGAHQVVDITVGDAAEDLVAYGKQLFVAVESGSEVIIIDTTTNTVSGHIDIGDDFGDGPRWMAVVETTTISGPDPKLYVMQGAHQSVTVVSLAQSDMPTTHFPFSSTYGGLRITPNQLADTRRGGLYVLDELDLSSGRLLVLSTQTNTVVEEIALGANAMRMVVSADGSRVYVTHPQDKLISVVDTTVTPPAVTRVPVAQNPCDVFLSPRGDRLYMTHFISQVAGLFRVIDLTTMLASSVNTGLQPWSIAGDDTLAYVSCINGKCIQVLDTTTVPPQLLETIPINGAPGYLAMSDDRKTLYANDFSGNAVHAVTVAAS
jgi:DNA-binding beta-propeller fold protein YncE